MNSKVIDISGQKFGRLTVIKFSHMVEQRNSKHRCGKRSVWKCLCDCGNEVSLRKDAFAYKYSRTKSCGCWHTEYHSGVCKKRNTEDNPAQKGDDHHMRRLGIRYPQCLKTGRFVKHKKENIA
jgi:hypothetical protein